MGSSHIATAVDWDGKSPVWMSERSEEKLRFDMWDKHSVYDKYDITYMVGKKDGDPKRFIATRSYMKGENPALSAVVFPDDFEEVSPSGPAYSLGNADIVWSIYVNGKLVLSGVDYGPKVTQVEINGKLVQFKTPR